MRALQILRLFSGFVLGALIISVFMGPVAIAAKELPVDRCALLPSSELQTVLGGSFGKPASSVAPPAFSGLPTGTECDYMAVQGANRVVFIIYVDSSAATAKDTFEKLTPYYSPVKSRPPKLGDSGYIDKDGAIHVLKGKVRFYINVTPTPAATRTLVGLATSVAGQL